MPFGSSLSSCAPFLCGCCPPPTPTLQAEITSFNRLFAALLAALRQRRDEGKPLPSLADYQKITNTNWTTDALRRTQTANSESTAKEGESGAMANFTPKVFNGIALAGAVGAMLAGL